MSLELMRRERKLARKELLTDKQRSALWALQENGGRMTAEEGCYRLHRHTLDALMRRKYIDRFDNRPKKQQDQHRPGWEKM